MLNRGGHQLTHVWLHFFSRPSNCWFLHYPIKQILHVYHKLHWWSVHWIGVSSSYMLIDISRTRSSLRFRCISKFSCISSVLIVANITNEEEQPLIPIRFLVVSLKFYLQFLETSVCVIDPYFATCNNPVQSSFHRQLNT